MGEAPSTAEVKGKTLTVWFNFQGQNGPMPIEMTGTVDGDSAKGTMGAGGQPGWRLDRHAAKDPKAKDRRRSPRRITAAAAKIDLTGHLERHFELANMTATPTIVLKQDGDKLTGDYISAQYGKFPLTGDVKGTEVTFSVAMNIEGNGLNATYTGVVDKDGSLKGSVDYRRHDERARSPPRKKK